MGFGGKLTVGGCKVGARNRLPASFFVSIAYMCWAYRRRGVVLDERGQVVEWLYHAPGEFEREVPDAPAEFRLGAQDRAGAIKLDTPLNADEVRRLQAGDVVLL